MMESNEGTITDSDLEQRKKTIEALIREGIIIMDPDHTYVDPTVRVASGVVLFPGTYLRGSTIINTGCSIGPDCWIEDSIIEQSCSIRYSCLEEARVREGTTVGPYAHLRPGTDVGPEAHIGNFVEVKNSRLECGVKAGHLSYIGDTDIGEGSNIGAGTITCNYDGKHKHRTTIERDAFIGSNASLVAPVTIGKESTVAAGSTITEDVPAGGLAFGRARQVNKTLGMEIEEEQPDAR
jgi:bifunctional UDP-N-acetylglucosamine pyrophosphorylase / glucosamine-1-phosphate N-acetyltransferase